MKIFLLILATFIWGLGFVGTRWTMEVYSPVWSNSLRFLFAGILVTPFVYLKRRQVNWRTGLILSTLLFIALMLQTYGIKYTTMAKSGFLTTFYAVFTPLILGLYLKRKFSYRYWGLVLLALLGMALLCELKFEGFNKGDAYILASALFFSLHIIFTDFRTKNESPILLNGLQCFLIGVIGMMYGIFFEGFPSLTAVIPFHPEFHQLVFWGFIILSLLSSLVAFTIQIYVQKSIPPHIVSMIFLMESIFASILGFIAFNETLSSKAIVGAFLVLLSVGLLPYFNKSD